jgi:predicted exporter
MMRSRSLIMSIWLLAVALAAVVIARAHYSADLSAFLPSAANAEQQLLVELLRSGPASQLLLMSIDGADLDTRARMSRELAQQLQANPAFSTVANGMVGGFERDRELLFRHRYTFSQAVTAERFTAAGLSRAMSANVALLGSSLGILGSDLLAHDPTGETQQILDQLDTPFHPRTYAGVWVSSDGERAVLMARTVAAGTDTDGQLQAINAIRSAFRTLSAARNSRVPPANLHLSGPCVFAAEARRSIQREVGRLSAISTLLIGALLLVVYRSVRLLILGFLPVVSGALAGVAAVALGFHVVYGITLGFGITLIGEAIDYPVYLFIQSARAHTAPRSRDWTVTNWPTVRLGMLTSVCGFAALLPSKFPGLRQLGLYSVAGLLSAALVTRYFLPAFLPARLSVNALSGPVRAFARGIAVFGSAKHGLWLVALLAIVVLIVHRHQLWNRELSALSPVSLSDQREFGTLSADLGAPDVRELVIVNASDAQSALRGAERVSVALEQLVANGEIAGFDSPSRYLPSQDAQRERRDSLPDSATLRARVALAADTAGLRVEGLQPFLQDLETARRAAPLTRADLEGTALAAGVDSLLVHIGAKWIALMPLRSNRTAADGSPINTAALDAALAGIASPGITATVLDLKTESDALYDDYLQGATRLSGIALAAITLLLLLSLRSIRRTANVLLPLGLSALVVAAGFALARHSMTILHLIGLLLIFAIGSNYALFFDRHSAPSDPQQHWKTLRSLLVANLTTVTGFGVLATSSVPVLSALGTTVAPGAFLAFAFSAILAGIPPNVGCES